MSDILRAACAWLQDHLPEQITAVRDALQDLSEASPDQIARQFQRARQSTVQPLLESLTVLGHARLEDAGRFAA